MKDSTSNDDVSRSRLTRVRRPRDMRDLLLWSALLGGATAFVVPTTLPAARLRGASLVMAGDNEPPEDRMAAFQQMRERARMRSSGVPQKEWAASSDIPDSGGAMRPPEQDGFTESTEAQKAAANELFERALLSKDAPDGFGDGIDEYLDGDYIDRPRV